MKLRATLAFSVLASLLAAGARAGSSDANLGLAQDLTLRVDGPIAAFAVSEFAQDRDLNGDGDSGDSVAHVFDARSGRTRNLGLASIDPQVRGRLVALLVVEGAQGADLNGDGDLEDSVVQVLDVRRGALRNLALAAFPIDGGLIDGDRFVFAVNEAEQGGADRNGDGDASDGVLHVLDIPSGRIVNTGLSVLEEVNRVALDISGRFMAVRVGEASQDKDLNGDGDLGDQVAHLVRLATGRSINLRLAAESIDRPSFQIEGNVGLISVLESGQSADLNGDGDRDDVVLQLVDVAAGRARNLGLDVSAGFPELDAAQDLAVFSVREDLQGGADLNGDGDSEDPVVHLLDTRTGRVRNTGIAASVLKLLDAGKAALTLSEPDLGVQLNDDGDMLDAVVHFVDARTMAMLANTGVAIDTQTLSLSHQLFVRASGDLFSFLSAEAEQGRDLNGDGDFADTVLHVSDVARGSTRNSRLEAALMARAILAQGLPPSAGRYAVPVQEAAQGGTDLNGDGDADDAVLHVFDARRGLRRNVGLSVAIIPPLITGSIIPALFLGDGYVTFPVIEAASKAADLNGDGDASDAVLHLVDLATGRATNTRKAIGSLFFAGLPSTGASFSLGLLQTPPVPGVGDAFVFGVSEAGQGDADLNGDGDTQDSVVHAVRLEDRNRDGRFELGR